MWNVNPLWMCDRHLMQEHADMHVAAEMLVKGHRLDHLVDRNLLEVHHIRHRHDRLENELEARGLGHRTSLPGRFPDQPAGMLNVQASRQKLLRTCYECARRQQALRTARDIEYFRATVTQLRDAGLLTNRAATQAVKRVDTVVSRPRGSDSSGKHTRPPIWMGDTDPAAGELSLR
jgi:hypothetical protein